MRRRAEEPSREDLIRQAREHLHVYDGFEPFLHDPREVFEIILGADDVADARAALRAAYDLDEIQANALLDLQFRRGARLERDRIEEQRREVRAHLSELEGEG